MLLSLATAVPHTHALFPIVRNFTRTDYSAGAQNWAITQSPDGTMMFGNSSGLLIYDSQQWRTLHVDNNSTVRSIMLSPEENRIYIGASGDFGYFSTDGPSRHLSFHSLRGTINTTDTEFSEIWNIHRVGQYVWFQGDFKIFCYNGEKTSCINTGRKITTSAIIDETLYVAFSDGSAARVRGSAIDPLKGCDALRDKKICAILPYASGELLIATAFSGLWHYSDGVLKPFPTDIDIFLKDNQIFCATRRGDKIVLGTVNNGAVIKDLSTGRNTFVNRSCGLQNNTVLCAAFDNLDNLWLGLDNGIDYVLANAPFYNLLSNDSFLGAGYASMLWQGRLYLGTNQGLYTVPAPSGTVTAPSNADIVSELKGQVWSLDTIGGTMFVASDAGLYYRRHGSFAKVDSIPGAWSVTQLRHHPGHALVSTYESFYLITRDASGEWHNAGRINGYSDIGGFPIEDNNGNIWISHWIKGIYRLTPTPLYRSFDHIDLLHGGNGLPSDANNSIARLDGRLLISTEDGLYRYDEAADSLIPDTQLNAIFPHSRAVHIYKSPSGSLWSVSPDNIITARTSGPGDSATAHIDSTTFRPLAKKIIPGFENLNFVGEKQLLLSSQDGFYCLDLATPRDSVGSNPVFIASIVANGDSTLYTATAFTAPSAPAIKIPHSLNSLYIEYVAPEYRVQNAVKYSVMLENYDNLWSQFTSSPSKEYTQLSEGNYTFRVRAFNSYTGTTSTCAIHITILPPWYRSLTAKIIYLLLGIAAIFMTLRMFRRYSNRAARDIAEKKEKEMESMKRRAHEEGLRKDYEIARLKSEQLEHDVRHKSGELSNITMNVIRKNEILLDIAARLSKIQETINPETDAANFRQIDKIKLLIRENISHDDDWRTFTRNFDLVYENYMKRLLEKYPSLSSTDQRLCAYIKMGLSSKEIAPLLNISYRSVEMTRYRLRKKMGLDRETNLAEYLRNF